MLGSGNVGASKSLHRLPHITTIILLRATLAGCLALLVIGKLATIAATELRAPSLIALFFESAAAALLLTKHWRPAAILTTCLMVSFIVNARMGVFLSCDCAGALWKMSPQNRVQTATALAVLSSLVALGGGLLPGGQSRRSK